MAVSIMHRVSGHGLAVVGLALLAWWLIAAATSDEAYAIFQEFATSWMGRIVWVGLSWLAFQHLLSGVRHLWLDAGFGYNSRAAQRSALAVFVGAVVMAGLFWAVRWGL